MVKKLQDSTYHNRPEWSYSDMKIVLDKGIDYAFGAKKKDPRVPAFVETEAVQFGTLCHQEFLGGEKDFAIGKYDNYRKAEAQKWRDEQIAKGIIPLLEKQFEKIAMICERARSHPFVQELMADKTALKEQPLFAKVDGLEMRGKADYMQMNGETVSQFVDFKFTAVFDNFARLASRMHYDLQTAVYPILKRQQNLANFRFFVQETIPPYRNTVAFASLEFVESGERKLRRCIDEILAYLKRPDQTPNFSGTEELVLGDLSW